MQRNYQQQDHLSKGSDQEVQVQLRVSSLTWYFEICSYKDQN